MPPLPALYSGSIWPSGRLSKLFKVRADGVMKRGRSVPADEIGSGLITTGSGATAGRPTT